MSGGTLAVDEGSRPYVRRLRDVLGAKGLVVLGAFPVLIVVSVYDLHPLIGGGFLVGAFSYALVLDTDDAAEELSPGSSIELKTDEPVLERIDIVGAVFVVLAVGYIPLAVFGIGAGWIAAGIAAVAVFGAVGYDYFIIEDDSAGDDMVNVDVVGFAIAEVLIFYAIVVGTGWTEFAQSATFGLLAFMIYTGTVAAFAGYAVVTREVIVSRTDDEIHVVLFGLLSNLYYAEEGGLSEDIAAQMREAADCLDGVKLPTEVKDEHGNVPAVVSTRRPDATVVLADTEEVLETADEERFTGYVVHGETVLLFRNGNLAKYYRDGEYGYDIEEVSDDTTVADAAFHSLDHSTLNDLDDITPTEEVTTPEEVEELLEDEKEDEDENEADDEEGDGEMGDIEVGGEEIDLDEMFQKAEEVMDELE